jgi:biopolymer transport protein ExbD
MTLWDVFYSERLEARKGLTTEEVRAKLKGGELGNADLIRPSGTGVPWSRMVDWPVLLKAASEPEPKQATQAAMEPTEAWVEPLPQSGSYDQVAGAFTPIPGAGDEPDEPRPRKKIDPTAETIAAPSHKDDEFAPPSYDDLEPAEEDEDDALMRPTIAEEPLEAIIDDEDDEEDHAPQTGMLDAIIDDEDDDEELGEFDLNLTRNESALALPAIATGKELWAEFADDDEDDVDEYDPEAEDEEAAGFTLARGAAERVEELDLAAMVDVAFQLVLFFLVTATTVLYKTLEVPKPNPETPPNAASQGAQSIEDLQDTYILVDIDASGNFKIDREPAPNTMKGLAERLRAARAATQRTAMLLTADFSTQHQHAVLAYDAANEIGLRIAIARPVPKPE